MKKVLPIYPLLFAVLPVLNLYITNKQEVIFSDIIRAIIASLTIAYVSSLVFTFIFKNIHKASFITFFGLFIFYSYYHISQFFPEFQIYISGDFIIGKHKLFISLIFLIYIFVFFKLHRTKRSLNFFSYLANLTTGCLILLFLMRIIYVSYFKGQTIIQDISDTEIGTTSREIFHKPDIYYIIVDGYARQDILLQKYGYDNSSFINYLQKQGFKISKNSIANYAHTYLSIASSLNMDYVDKLVPDFNMDYQSNSYLRNLIDDNKVFKYLKGMDYKIVAFSSGYDSTEIGEKADIYYYQAYGLNYFEYKLLNTTLVRRFGIFLRLDLNKVARDRVLFNMEKLQQVPEIPEPTFTFLHIIMPHPPFIFDADGNTINKGVPFTMFDGSSYKGTKEQYRKEYIGQLEYLNKRMIIIVDQLINRSGHPPVIIIQSDHGPGMNVEWDNLEQTDFSERMSNFMAVYAPKSVLIKYNDQTSPVNIFRILFSGIFQEDFPELPNISYYSQPQKPFKFYDVQDGKIVK